MGLTPTLDRTNSHGITVLEGLTVWRVSEARLCDRINSVDEELSKFPLSTTLDTVWDQLTEAARDAVADAWCENSDERQVSEFPTGPDDE